MTPIFSLKLLYFFYFFYLGVYINLMSGHFQDLHFTGPERALIFGTIPIVAFFSNLIWGRIADSRHSRKNMILIFSLLCSVIFVVTLWVDCFWGFVFMSFGIGLFSSPMIPLTDSLALSACSDNPNLYGRFRQWGTIAFIAANVFLMILLFFFEKQGLNGWHLLFLMPVLMLCLAMVAPKIQDYRETFIPIPKISDLLPLFKNPGMGLFFLAALLHNIAYVGNYAYFSAHLKILGSSESWIALCWAITPLGEIFIFRHSQALLKRVTPVTLFRVALATGILRWGLLSFLHDPLWIALSQLLHALSFGGYYLASMILLSKWIPEHWRSSGQALFASLCINLGMVSGNILMGYLFEIGGTFLIFQASTFLAFGAFILSLFLKL